MKFKSALTIGLLAVGGALVPAVANAHGIHNEAGVNLANSSAKVSSLRAGDNSSFLQKQANTLFTEMEIEGVTSGSENGYSGAMTEGQKKQLDFMKSIYTSKDVSALFEGSSKKNNMLFTAKEGSNPFAFAFDKSCIVNVGVDNNGVPVKLNYQGEEHGSLAKKLNINDADGQLYNEMVVRHEIAHCRFADYAAPLNLSADKKLNSFLNEVVRDSAPVTGESATQMINESFADSLAMIQMMVKYGVDDPAVNSLFNKVHSNRESTALKVESSGMSSMDQHDAHHGVKLLLTQEYKDKIRQIAPGDAKAMESLALDVGNKAVIYKLSHLSEEDNSKVFNMANLKKSASDNVSLEIYKENTQDFKRGLFGGSSVITRFAEPDNQMRGIAKDYINQMKKDGSFDAYKENVTLMSYKMSDRDRGNELASEFLKKYSQAKKSIASNEVNLEENINKSVKERFGFTAEEGLDKLKSEFASYKFKSPLVEGNVEQVIAKRAAENAEPLNFKQFTLPSNIAEKMDFIRAKIEANNTNQQTVGMRLK